MPQPTVSSAAMPLSSEKWCVAPQARQQVPRQHPPLAPAQRPPAQLKHRPPGEAAAGLQQQQGGPVTSPLVAGEARARTEIRA